MWTAYRLRPKYAPHHIRRTAHAPATACLLPNLSFGFKSYCLAALGMQQLQMSTEGLLIAQIGLVIVDMHIVSYKTAKPSSLFTSTACVLQWLIFTNHRKLPSKLKASLRR